MRFPKKEEVELIKKLYPVGTKLVIDNMDDPCNPVSNGTMGTVYAVDDIGQIHCEEFGLALVYGVDKFHKV